MQRDNMQVTQPSSPLASPGAFSSASVDSPFAMPSRSVVTVAVTESVASSTATSTVVSGNAFGNLTLSASMSSSSLGGSAALSSSSSANTNVLQQHYQFHNAAADDTDDPKWQATKATVRERNAAMFNNDLMADITFVVGAGTVPDEHVQTIPAHKYVLATGSSVFFAMFFGGLADDTQKEITVPDVEPMAFLTLLK